MIQSPWGQDTKLSGTPQALNFYGGKMTFSEYTNEWRELILTLKKPASRATMESHIRKACETFGKLPLDSISEKDIQIHLTTLSKEVSAKSVKNYWGTLRLVFKQAVKEGLIPKIPSPELPKTSKQPQPWLTAQQLKFLLVACPPADKELWWLFAETGLRAGEVFGLRIEDINLDEKYISVNQSVYGGQGQTPKTANAIRSISISQELANLIHHYVQYNSKGELNPIRSTEGFLFCSRAGTPLRQPNVLKFKLYPLLKTCGIEPGGFHMFRRGNASIMASLGVPEKLAADRLGHGLPGLTFGTYAQSGPVRNADKEVAEKIAAELKNPSSTVAIGTGKFST
jgi:integrase